MDVGIDRGHSRCRIRENRDRLRGTGGGAKLQALRKTLKDGERASSEMQAMDRGAVRLYTTIGGLKGKRAKATKP